MSKSATSLIISLVSSGVMLMNKKIVFTIAALICLGLLIASFIWSEMSINRGSANPPIQIDSSPRFVIACQNNTVSQKWTDPNGLASYAFNHNASGSWLPTNITGNFHGEETAWSNVTVAVGNDSTKVIATKFYAKNTLNLWSYVYREIPIVWNNYKAERLSQVENSAINYIKHSLGRTEFYDNITNLYWIFWANTSSAIFYNYSSDGYTWNKGAFVVEDPDPVGGGGGKFYVNTGTIDGISYVYYMRCSESVNAPIRFRRGRLHADGTISWVPESILHSGTNVQQQAVNGLWQSPSGYVWAYFFCIWSDDTRRMYVTFTQSTNGTWITYAGYPKSAFSEVATPYNEGYVYGINDTSCYVITTQTSGSLIYGKKIANHVLGTVETVTNYPLSTSAYASGRQFSGVSVNGDIHIVYRANDEKIRYSWRNNTSNAFEVKDELVSQKADYYTYPVIGYDRSTSAIYCNWLTSDGSIWLMKRTTAWSHRIRLALIPINMTIFGDPNTVIEYATPNGDVIINLVLVQTNYQLRIWTLLCRVPEDTEAC